MSYYSNSGRDSTLSSLDNEGSFRLLAGCLKYLHFKIYNDELEEQRIKMATTRVEDFFTTSSPCGHFILSARMKRVIDYEMSLTDCPNIEEKENDRTVIRGN